MQVYSKPHLEFSKQIDLLKSRGLVINNDLEMKNILRQISYYRLSGYFYSFLEGNKEKHQFIKGTTIEDVLKIYCFDKELRQIILNATEKIEISLRTLLIYYTSEEYGAEWYNNSAIFELKDLHKEQLERLENNFQKSDEVYITHFKERYSNPIPPAWIAMELISFNQTSQWLKNLIDKGVKKKISFHFESNYIELESWIHAIVYLRNLCAHHCKVWNRRLVKAGRFPKNPLSGFISLDQVTNTRIYFTVSIIQYLLEKLGHEHNFKSSIIDLIDRNSFIDISEMGFPSNWRDDPFWK